MKIAITFDKWCRSISGWLVYHRFLSKEWSPLKNNLAKRTEQTSKTLLQTVSEYNIELDGNTMLDATTKTFMAHSAFMCRDWINPLLFDLTKYKGHSEINTKQSYTVSVTAKANLALMLKDYNEFLAKNLNFNPETGKWTRFMLSVPQLLLYRYFNHPDVRAFYSQYVQIISCLVSLEKKGMHITDPKLLSDVETQLIHVLCSGLDIYGFTLYQEMLRILPTEFSGRMPLVKLKMKHISAGDYIYTPVALNGV